MKITRVSLLGLIAALVLLPCSCNGGQSADSEISSYLTTMKGWYDEWEELFWDDWCRPAEADCDARFDEIIAGLFSIDPPNHMYREHCDYRNAHKIYVLAARHLYLMQDIEEERFTAVGNDEIPDCEVVLYYDGQSVSTEYEQACRIEYWAFENLCQVRAHWKYDYFAQLED